MMDQKFARCPCSPDEDQWDREDKMTEPGRGVIVIYRCDTCGARSSTVIDHETVT